MNVEEVQTTDELGFSMDGYLKKNLEMAKAVVKKDWDMVFVVDGAEGSGKSVLAQQAAYYCDRTINIDRICFTPKEFKNAIKSAEKYQAVVYDEAYTGLSSRAAMSLINRTLVTMLAEIRQKNLFVFVVMPTFFDLDKYVALWRSRALLHVYTKENFERGYFSFFNVDRKKALYLFGKKFYSYSATKANFIGRFPKPYVVDEEIYRKKKMESLSKDVEEDDPELKKKFEEWLFLKLQNPSLGIKVKDKAQLMGLMPHSFTNKSTRYKKEQEKEGNTILV